MKVLIIHQYFKTPQSGGAIRSYFLAKALVDRGHQAVVITSHNEGSYKQQNLEGIDVHFLPVSYDNSFRFYARGLAFLRFVARASSLGGRIPGVHLAYVITVPLTTGLIARWLKWRYRIPYIFEVGDLWPDAPVQMGVVKNFFLKKFLYWMESVSYAGAESIVALSPALQSAISKKTSGKTIHLIPNMADCDFFKPEEKSAELAEKLGVVGKFVVSCIGAMGVANGLEHVLACAHACSKVKLSVHFILCGDGALRDQLIQEANGLGLDNVTFANFTNRDGVKEVLNVTDAVFVSYARVPILETGSPNKFFDGLAAGKIIVINFGGWIKQVIEDNRCGVFVAADRPQDFVSTISPFLEDQTLLRQYQAAARSLAESKYSRSMLSGHWIGILGAE